MRSHNELATHIKLCCDVKSIVQNMHGAFSYSRHLEFLWVVNRGTHNDKGKLDGDGIDRGASNQYKTAEKV